MRLLQAALPGRKCGKYKTVKARFWLAHLSSCCLFARKREERGNRDLYEFGAAGDVVDGVREDLDVLGEVVQSRVELQDEHETLHARNSLITKRIY